MLDKSEREHKKVKGGNENKMQQYCCNNICNAVATISYIEYKDVLLNNKYIQYTQWIEFKIKTIEYEYMKSAKFHCHVLMTKYILKAMDMME